MIFFARSPAADRRARRLLGLTVAAILLAWPASAPGFGVSATDSSVQVTSQAGDQASVKVDYVQGQRFHGTSWYAQTVEVSTSAGLTNASPDRCQTVSPFLVRCHLAAFTGSLDPGTAPALTADVPWSLTLTGKNELDPGQARPIVGSIKAAGGRLTLGDRGTGDIVGPFTVDFTDAIGNGEVVSGPANDTLKGGPGNDRFSLRSGDLDAVTGGNGKDTVDYAVATAGVTARIGGPAGDDALATDIENLTGSDFADVLIGDDGPNRIETTNRSFLSAVAGSAGDTVDARDGDDIIVATTPATFAQPAPTVIEAGGGNDQVGSVGGTNEISGETGNDTITVALGTDVVDGGLGDDVVASQQAPTSGTDDLRGGGGTDTISYAIGTPGPLTIDLQTGRAGTAGAPADQLDSLAGFENARGGGAGDTLIGDDGPNLLQGEGGDDRLVGAGGADVLAGGAGSDSADYTQATTAVQVRLDGLANDGAPGEGDDVQGTIEVLEGGPFGDTLVGDESSERLIGNAGDDTLDGGLGADEMFGGDGSDTVDYASRTIAVSVDPEPGPIPPADDGAVNEFDAVAGDIERVLGGAGDDTLIGGPGSQSLFGGDGADLLVGGPGTDLLVGGYGDDTLSSADDAEDHDQCGAGSDSAAADTLDTVDADCETVARAIAATGGEGAPGPSGGGAPPSAPPSGSTFITVSISAATVTLTTSGVAGIPVSCPPQAAGGCRGVITLQTANGIPVVVLARKVRRRIVKLGSARYAVPAGSTRTVRIRLSRRNQRLLTRLRRVKVRATVRPQAGTGPKSERVLTLKAAARRPLRVR